MKMIFVIAVALTTLFGASASAGLKYVPNDSSLIVWSVGAGLGVPYGAIGGKASLGIDRISGEIGLGLAPFIWESVISVGGVVHLNSQYAAVRPKLTIVCSNMVAFAYIYEQGSLDALYKETYAGIGTFAGIDWRVSKTSPLCLDVNIGWVFPFVGFDEIRNRYNDAVDSLRRRGYWVSEETIALATPKISIGLVYSPQRSLKPIFSQ